jgi:hypothetical protein
LTKYRIAAECDPDLHFVLFFVGVFASRVMGWERMDSLRKLLGIIDFPVSLLTMMLAWVLPEFVLVLGFGIERTLWWYYLGRKADQTRW